MDKTNKLDIARHENAVAAVEDARTGSVRYPSEAEGGPRDIADELIELARAVQGIHARVAARHGLTPIQAKLLFVLMLGPRVMGSLTAPFGVEKSALTGLVDRVERRGLVTRTPVPGDRRAFHVTLTDAGQEAAAAFYVDAKEELNQLLARLAPHEREQFHGALTTVNRGKDDR